MSTKKYKSPLHEMTQTTRTEYWNDSCAVSELKYAIEHGAVGATANPVIVSYVLGIEMDLWKDHINRLINDMPDADEERISWKLVEDMSAQGAKLLEPIFNESGGKKGRLSIQTDPKNYRNPKAMVDQAVHFHNLAPNMIVKIPVTSAGVTAIEEATYQGVVINATVSFSVPQALAVGEAIEKGLQRRKAGGKDISSMSPVCTIMVGRLDDWLKVVANRDNIVTEPAYLEWAGVAAMKKAYEIYQERGYTTRLLSAATRNHMHWSEFIGGDVVVTMTNQWQRRFNACDVEVKPRMDNPVAPAIIKELSAKFADFDRAYRPDGMTVEEFDTFGPTLRTLRGFIRGGGEFVGVIRDFMLPNPDVK